MSFANAVTQTKDVSKRKGVFNHMLFLVELAECSFKLAAKVNQLCDGWAFEIRLLNFCAKAN